MNKQLYFVIFLLIMQPYQALASSCKVEGYTIAFFNGVANTERGADNSLDKLITTLNYQQYQGEKVDYQLFYNESNIESGGINIIADLAETFDQRTEEMDQRLNDKWELFWELMNGRGEGSIAEKLGTIISTPISFFNDLFSKSKQEAISFFLERLNGMVDSPETEITQRNHRLINDALTWQGKKLIYIAHSQGNLWMNRSFDYATSQKGYDGSNVKAIHIAPASPLLKGDYILSGNDLVINGLQLTGIGSVPKSNFTATVSDKGDISGHKLIETYLTDTKAISMLKASVSNAFSNVQTPAMYDYLFEITYEYSPNFVATHETPQIKIVDNNNDWLEVAPLPRGYIELGPNRNGPHELRPVNAIERLPFTHERPHRDFNTVTIDQCEDIPNDKAFVLGEYSKETVRIRSIWPIPHNISTTITIRDRYGWELLTDSVVYGDYRTYYGYDYIGSFTEFKAMSSYNQDEKRYLERYNLGKKYSLVADGIVFTGSLPY
ncbi:hypothetical protein [Salinivibrio sp. SS2]|uniref:hypothetical protein n=1 Tax=Salinivibrio sp. SS2 TaxID=1892894 RepID=UPI000B16BD40|nr:hypothetical protein [Salinivibrio sp. DV]